MLVFARKFYALWLRLWRCLGHAWVTVARWISPGISRLILPSREIHGRPEEPKTTEAEVQGDDFSEETRGLERGGEGRNEKEFLDEEYRYKVNTADEFYCDYDSTWETEENLDDPPLRTGKTGNYKFDLFINAARDMQNFRHGYQTKVKQQYSLQTAPGDKPNLSFYRGERPSAPDGLFIHCFHDQWYGQYDILEYVHTYIQWLFPLEEPGMNPEARILTKEEIKEFRGDPIAMANLLKSYKLMLDFYGIEMWNEETGMVRRASNWRERFNNLNSHRHNNLRISRILKCLGTLGYRHYQAPLVHFFLEETLVHRELPNVRDSALNYFLFTVLDPKKRRSLLKFAYFNYDRKEEFVWCPRKIQRVWSSSAVARTQGLRR